MGIFSKKETPHPVTKQDLSKLVGEIGKQQERIADKENIREIGKKATRMLTHGIGNIAKSMASPDDKRRPRIARMGMHPDIAIRTPDYNNLISPGLRGKDIRGRRK